MLSQKTITAILNFRLQVPVKFLLTSAKAS